MAEGDDSNLIRITHYINPHMFWFKYESSLLGNARLFELDSKLQKYYFDMHQKLGLRRFQPATDEMVGVFNFSWNRWIRGRVDHIVEYTSSAPKYIVWAVDYGVPLQSDARWIRELPRELAEVQVDSVCFGGIGNIVPAEKTYDFVKNCATVEVCDKWSTLAVKMIDDLISDAASIKFIREIKGKSGQLFGNLEITTHTNQLIKANIVLLETNQATTTNDFFRILQEIGTNKIPRWETNDGNTLVFKYHSNKITNDKIKYDSKIYDDRKTPDPARSEIDMEIEKKVTDWEQRNQETHFKEEVTIDDISFNDSASVAVAIATPRNAEQHNANHNYHEDDGEQAYKVAGSSRKKRLERYKKYVPKLPSDNDSIPPVAREVKKDYEEKSPPKNQVGNSIVSSGSEPKANSSVTNPNDNSDSKSLESGNSPPVMNSRVTKLMNKRKSIQAKLNQMPENVIPAGFDLRNLQPTKADKQTKNHSFHSSSSSNREINDISNSMSKMNVAYQNKNYKNKQNNRPLEEVDEVCVPSNLTSHLVLVHGKHIARPIEKLANANFCEDVHRELEHMRLNHIYRIQSYAWPHLMRGNSLMIINSARTGKTMSYLPAICSLIKMKFDDGIIPDGVGPLGIIVAPSSVEVEKITRICKRFFHSCSRKMSIVESYGIRTKEKAISYLLNGCEILVATPPALARLLSEEVKLFDSKRIQHLVIDNIDLMHEELRSDLHLILRKCCSLSKNNNKTSVQMVVTTRAWHSLVSGFLKICNNPQLCIGAYIEAAVYAQSEFKMRLIEKRSKCQEMFEFLKTHPYQGERTLIVCNTDEDVELVSDALKDASCFFTSVCGRSTADEIELVSEWHYRPMGDMSILLCTDSVLPELKLKNVQNLIHYSLPISWSKFVLRFSTLFGYYEDLLKTENEQRKHPAVTLILLDENNNSQLPKLIEFLQKHNCDSIPKEILNLSNKIKIQREEARISNRLEFCPHLMEFGTCLNQSDCKYRHVLTKFDAPDDGIPTEGMIIVKILNIISPTHYCVRLLEHTSSKKVADWKKVKNSNEYLKFNLEFSEYFSDFQNHQTHWPINVNDLCVAIEMKTCYRCRILEAPKSSSNKLTHDVSLRVKLVDFGRIILCKSSNLLVLPERFKDFPFQAVDLRLTDIVPYDFEYEWESKATDAVRQWVENRIKTGFHVRASVNFTLMDTIWVDNIILMEELKSISSNVYGVNIKKALLERQFATINSRAVEIITEMARECGILKISKDKKSSTAVETPRNDESSFESSHNISTSTTSDTVTNSRKIVKPSSYSDDSEIMPLLKQHVNKPKGAKRTNLEKEKSSIINEKWEMLPENDFTRVFIGSFYSPNTFYVQNVRNLKSMEELYDEIDDFVALRKVPLKEPKIGLNCLAKYDGKYNRGKITKVVCDAEENKIKATIFFCDIGISETHSLGNIVHSSSRIVSFMPFQAIRCKLTGITSTVNGIWTEETCDAIYENIINESDYLYVRPVNTQEPKLDAELRFWRYEVIMIDCSSEKDVKLNEKIVEKGYAEYDSETKHFLDLVINVPVEREFDSDLDEEETWDDINYVRPPLPAPSSAENHTMDLSSLQSLDVDINFTEEEALQLLNLPPSAKILPPIEENKVEEESRFTELEKKSHKSSLNGSIKDQRSTISSSKPSRGRRKLVASLQESNSSSNAKNDEVKDPLMPQLKNLYKSPSVIWQQSESLICLSISTPDIDDYHLKVTSTTLIFSAYIEKEKNMVLMNFLGSVEPHLTSHEIRGVSVIVRLVKSLKGFTWPRLLWEEDKPLWLKYNYDAIVVKDKLFHNTGQKISWDSYNFEDSSFDSSDSDIAYEALCDVDNDEKVFDPLADDFD